MVRFYPGSYFYNHMTFSCIILKIFMHNSKDFAHQNTITKGQNGMHKINCTNAFDVFGKIPGTPAYWKSYRNELLARMEQLGPFHFFSHYPQQK